MDIEVKAFLDGDFGPNDPAMIKGCKVLHMDRGSVITRYLFGDFYMSYPKHIWVKQLKGFGPLAVFRSEDMARTFVKSQLLLIKYDETLIVPCVYEISSQRFLHVTKKLCKTASVLDDYYRNYDTPPGTDFATRVYCLE